MQSDELWPAGFRYIERSVSNGQIQNYMPTNTDKCGCVGSCEIDSCLNFETHDECNDHICSAPHACNNRMVTNQNISYYVRIRRTRSMGVGAFAKRPIEEGVIIMEYTGDIISESEKNAILNDTSLQNHYIMQGVENTFINAANCGNESRFVNHGCNPNLKVIKWYAGGKELRVMQAARYIDSNEQLLFDYAFDYAKKLTKCKCGAMNCRQYINKTIRTSKTKRSRNNAKRISKPINKTSNKTNKSKKTKSISNRKRKSSKKSNTNSKTKKATSTTHKKLSKKKKHQPSKKRSKRKGSTKSKKSNLTSNTKRTKRKRSIQSSKKFKCNRCSLVFDRKWNLERHIARKHLRSKPFKCDTCGRGFATKLECTNHKVTHTKDKPFSCAKCNKRFSHPKSVWRHQKFVCTK